MPPYELVGVIEHAGSMRAGHYVAYVRRRASAAPPPPSAAAAAPAPAGEQQGAAAEGCAAGTADGKGGHAGAQTARSSSKKRAKHASGGGGAALGSGPNTGAGAGHAWFYVSDTTVRQVPEAQVLRAQAYVLMYARE